MVSYKVLGQVVPSADTLTSVYTAPASTSAVCSTLSICNQGLSTTFRVAVRPSGATISSQHYVVYDNYINSNDTIFLTLGITLSEGDVVSVQAASANVSFGLFGSEIA